MTHVRMLAALALVGLALGGCRGPIGTWKMQEITPASGAAHFGVHKITFKPDNTFEAEVLEDGRIQQIEGTYVYDQKAALLTLNEADGGTRRYAFESCQGCGYIYFMDAGGSGEWRAKMVRR